jgi:phosphoribosyl 1,2-cyclic phosphodiesterase
MALHFTVLASGSLGNASLLEADGFGVLIDAGLGPRQLAQRLAAVGRSWRRIHAVVLTHTHGDHWRGRTFAYLARHGIPLYCHAAHVNDLVAESAAFCRLADVNLVRYYEPDTSLALAPCLRLRPFAVSHDGGATCGFRFDGPADFFGPGWALAYVADLGAWPRQLVERLCDVDVLALEFNHDVAMERRSGRPRSLINRILSARGHLSNEQAAALVDEVARRSERGRLRHLVQLHLSRDCNRPSVARAAVQRLMTEHGFNVHTARQDRPGPRLRLGAAAIPRRTPARGPRPVTRSEYAMQRFLPGWEEEDKSDLQSGVAV